MFAKTIVVQGEVHGNITASERIDIRDNGSVDGDLSSPRVSIADGAHFRGAIDMQKGKPATDAKPADHKPSGTSATSGTPATSVTPAASPNPVAAAPANR